MPLLTDLSQRAGVSLDERQLALLERYLDLLEAGNQRMNLTRIVDRASAIVQHLGDSLTLLPLLPAGPAVVADVGTGAGVPGIPLAIARPDLRVELIEATGKKCVFLRETITELGLTNVKVHHARAEDAGNGLLRERCDVVVARAVATMDFLAEWCLPLVKLKGKMLAMKGPKVNDELPVAKWAIDQLGGGSPVVHAVDLPGTEHRVIVEIAKIKKTDSRFPRPASAAKGKALRR